MRIIDFIHLKFSELYKKEYGSLQNERKLGFYGYVGMVNAATKGIDLGHIKCRKGCEIPDPSPDGNICLSCGSSIYFEH